MRPVRALVVLSIALLLGLGLVRAMTFVAPGTHPLRGLAAWFDSHPAAVADKAMTQIGTAAARGQSVPALARRAMIDLARLAPLSDDPFLVEGTIAQMAGNTKRSERLFVTARDRNPRSQGARYFLADLYLKTDRIFPGLVEMGVLARLSETASQSLAPALADYARSPGATDQLRRYFATSPAVRDSTLALLASDARNKSIVLALAPRQRPGAPAAEWQGRLVQALIASGDYAGAEALWSRFAGVHDRGRLFNPQFRKLHAPPPFNWTVSAGSAGVAEATGDGGLDVIYYGREEAAFASQVLRLAPGRYRLAMRVDGPAPAAGLAWTIMCLRGSAALLHLPVGIVAKGDVAGNFTVPATDCEAQTLELRGRPVELSGSVQTTITNLRLDPSRTPS